MGDETLDRTLPGSPAAGPFASLRPGSLFAHRFEIRERLGAGGAGEVFRVLDRLAGEEAALKVLYPAPDAGSGLERLRRELKIARGLEHPGIVRLRDIGEHDGLLYLLMPLLAGETLRERLARGPLAFPDAVRLFDGVLDALAFAHERGVIHRDVKPANIFITRQPDGAERVVLVDFGTARDPAQPSLTVTGQFLGTPEYVSPEQARGDRSLGPASDVYSAGVVLWEMLAGSPPFTGGNSLEILVGHTTRTVPSARRALPDAPAWLRDLLLAMLEKAPEHRPRDAGEVRARLREGRREAWTARLLTSLRRSRPLHVVPAAALALAIGGLAFALWPVDVAVQGSTARALSRAGFVVHRFELPGAITNVEPLGDGWWSARRRLVALRPEANTTVHGYPERLVEIDLLTGSMRRFALSQSGEDWSQGPPHGNPRFDRNMMATGLERTPWSRSDEEPRFVVTWAHAVHYPSVAAEFRADGTVEWILTHPGRLGGDIQFASRGDGIYPGVRTVLLHGVNNALGGRHVIVGINESVHPGTRLYVAAPFDERAGPGNGDRQPPYQTFLSLPLPYSRLQADQRSARLIVGGNSVFAAEPTTCIPLDGSRQAGLSSEQWRSQQLLLNSWLLDAASKERDGRALEVADQLRARVDSATLDPTQRGVALARIAELYREAGRYDDALRAAQDARALEPLVPGHLRLVIDLAVRSHRWPEVRRSVAAASMVDLLTEAGRDAVLAALISGSAEEARALATGRDDSDYGLFEHTLIALHEGKWDDALAMLARDRIRWPETSFLRALALASMDTPRCQEASDALALAEHARGSGWALPFVPLRAFLARRCGLAAPSPEAVEGALADERRAARTNIVDLYFSAWGERLAKGVPLAWAGPGASPGGS